MTNEELAIKIQNGEEYLLHTLWDQVQKFVAYKARLVPDSAKQASGCTYDDLYDAGYLALAKAAKTYKSDAGTKFITWLDYYLKAIFAEETGIRTARDRNDPIRIFTSLSCPIGDDTNDGILSDITADPQSEAMLEFVEERIFAEQLRDAVRDVLDDIPTEQSAVIRKRYLEGLTQEQTGQELGVDKNEVVRREEAALRLLRRGRYASKLRPFYDYNYYSGTGLQSFLRTGISVQEKYVLAREKLEQKAARAAKREDPN